MSPDSDDPRALDFRSPSRLPPRSDPPDPLTTVAGEAVADADDWRDVRRPEIRTLFRHYVYGHAPDPVAVTADVERTEGALDGRATLTEATLRFAGAPDELAVDLALFTPSGAGEVPVALALNRAGNHGTVADGAVSVTASGRAFGADDRGARESSWCVERIVERGYGLATFHQADVDPDRDDFADGVHAAFDTDSPPGTEWGTLAAWAWGLRRAVDYLRTDDLVDGDSVVVTGHSRRGKAALLAGATDERIALVAPHQSGTGGTALSRGNDQETVASITGEFPHWFADAFVAFAGRESRLPVDQHLLVSLVAPRPLLDTEGARDYWANPGLALDSLRAADPVYDLFGVEGTVDGGLLHGDDPITADAAGRLLQYRRETDHAMEAGYWDALLDFADLHL